MTPIYYQEEVSLDRGGKPTQGKPENYTITTVD